MIESKIQIVDSGIGNIGSVANMLKKIGYSVEINSKPDDKNKYGLTFLPGVGSFDTGINRLKKTGWFSYIKDNHNSDNFRILGICLGMQLLCEGSEEGNLEGLSIIPGFFKRFDFQNKSIKIPHMGWNHVEFNKKGTKLWPKNEKRKAKFYFVHSFKYFFKNNAHTVGVTEYGSKKFSSIIEKGNALGMQFHPEKSHIHGQILLRNYISLTNANS